MKIIHDKISTAELKEMAQTMFGNLVKAVVDIKLEKMAVDAELHSDERLRVRHNLFREDRYRLSQLSECAPGFEQ